MPATVYFVDGSIIRFENSTVKELNEVLKKIPLNSTMKAFYATTETKGVLVNWDNVTWIEDVVKSD